MADDERWAAVVSRNQAADGLFVYCVKTTKIFCRPTCKARLARRANVEFYDTPHLAEAAGYRACKRCQPWLASYTPEADKIKKARDLLEALPENAPLPGLDRLAQEAGLTKHHFHRLFKRETGLTPRQYALSLRHNDKTSESTNSAAMTPITPFTGQVDTPIMADSDFFMLPDADPSVLQDSKDAFLDVEALIVYYSILQTTYGFLLVAFQQQEICKIELGTSEQELLGILDATFPSFYYLHSPVAFADGENAAAFQQRIESVVQALENPTGKILDLPSSVNDRDTVG